MVLPQCTLFPHSLLPLFIFEPRYQAMLAETLQQHRMFAIGYLDGETTTLSLAETDARIRPITTCGVVRACVGRPDGTSHLMLQGLQRVRIVEWIQREPFRIARIKPLPPLLAEGPVDLGRTSCLLTVVSLMLAAAPTAASTPSTPLNPLLEELKQVTNFETLMDIVAANFLVEGAQRQQFLELSGIEARWEFIIPALTKMVPKF
jgi:Lon protease-like protein